ATRARGSATRARRRSRVMKGTSSKPTEGNGRMLAVIGCSGARLLRRAEKALRAAPQEPQQQQAGDDEHEHQRGGQPRVTRGKPGESQCEQILGDAEPDV